MARWLGMRGELGASDTVEIHGKEETFMDFMSFRFENTLALTVCNARVDESNADEFYRGVKGYVKEDNTVLVLELSKVRRLTSAGLRALLMLAKDMGQKGGSVCVKGATDHVKKILNISGFDRIIEVVE